MPGRDENTKHSNGANAEALSTLSAFLLIHQDVVCRNRHRQSQRLCFTRIKSSKLSRKRSGGRQRHFLQPAVLPCGQQSQLRPWIIQQAKFMSDSRGA